ncbi:MAG: cupin domain-containing protein [Rhodospirillaceae bacterium]|nr:cupin domain-containing protein [Rhodospirillaceae bacterium]
MVQHLAQAAVQRVNGDFRCRVVSDTAGMGWVPSPQAGVERRMLDRIGGEVARATSLVRYAPASRFPEHVHALGEEFLVLAGVFSDETGDFPAGSYVRNPPGSRHAPFTRDGCTIFVKLRQMRAGDRARVVVDSVAAPAENTGTPGHRAALLHADPDGDERVTLERLDPGTRVAPYPCPGGEEILVLAGTLRDEDGDYRQGTWIRNPDAHRHGLATGEGCTLWVKRGHLRGL